MNPWRVYQLPSEKKVLLKRAVILEWLTIFFLITIVIVMYLAMGSSQSMKTAWVEDLLSLIPPITFLVALRCRSKPPTKHYPYGLRRAPSLAFLGASTAVLAVGLLLLYESVKSLLSAHHPTIGLSVIFGYQIWSGWVMIAALIYSIIPPVILGYLKHPLSKALHEKTLHADAAMNKADWLTGISGIAGILGIALGWWWADAAAAALIAADISKDGFQNARAAMGDLANRAPSDPETREVLNIESAVRDKVLSEQGVRDCVVRIHEDGHVFSGELFVVFDAPPSPERIEVIVRTAESIDSRLFDLVLMPVTKATHMPTV